MAIARSTGVFLGTDESTGVTITNNATGAGTEVDVLGDNTSTGVVHLYLAVTSTVTAGSIDVKVSPRRLTGQAYLARSYQFAGVPPTNGTQLLYLGSMSATRFMRADALNNATGASATNVAVLYELHKVS